MTSLTGLKPPGPLILDNNAATNRKKLYRAYNIYATAAGVISKPEDIQCCVFLHVAGEEAQHVHANLQFQSGEEDRIEPLIKVFKTYCTGRANIIIIQYRFNSYMETTEYISSYITALRDQINDCDYRPMKDSLVHDRIVAGVKKYNVT